MNQELAGKHKKPAPWKSAVLCLGAAIAGPAYGLSQMETFLKLINANREASNAELEVLITPLFVNVTTVIVPVVVVALVAGILNIIFVTRGCSKWPLIVSSIGILISIGALGMLFFAWMNMGGNS